MSRPAVEISLPELMFDVSIGTDDHISAIYQSTLDRAVWLFFGLTHVARSGEHCGDGVPEWSRLVSNFMV